MTTKERKKTNSWLAFLGIIMLFYAIIGNYVALPGYIRFLERGGTSAGVNTLDLSVLIGAVKTILWMYSFQLGVLLLSIAYSIRERLHTKTLILLLVLVLLCILYILFGSIIVVLIILCFMYPNHKKGTQLSNSLFLGAVVFFSFATWEVCGLGSTGRMLHPEQSSTPLALNLLITQSTKLMFEFVLAWGLLFSSLLLKQRNVKD